VQLQKAKSPEVLYQLEQVCFLPPLSFEAIVTYFEGDQYSSYLLVDGDKPVCFAILMEIPDECELIRIGTIKESRGTGKAFHLLKKLMEYYSSKGFLEMFLEVAKKNLPARRLYWKLGFRKFAIRKNYYGHNSHAHLLKTRL
jgi:ribosomal protein S18 acetylase RimI-like enzyme